MAAPGNPEITVCAADGDTEEDMELPDIDGEGAEEQEEDGPDDEPSFMDKVVEYMQDTSAHGIAKVLDTVSRVGRICWFVCLLGSFGLFFYQTSRLTQFYLSNPVLLQREVCALMLIITPFLNL